MMLQSPAKYFPFVRGNYNTKPNLFPLGENFGNGQTDKLLFQIDDNFEYYHNNKSQCREENLLKYHQTYKLPQQTQLVINQFLIEKLGLEYPQFFDSKKYRLYCSLTQETLNWDEDYQLNSQSIYISLFDALAGQVQEDLAIVQLMPDKDYLTSIHLCSPNYWSPAEKIGKNFSAIHQPVAGLEEMNQRYRPMLEAIAKKPSTYVRFAWGLTTDQQLNHHPEAPPNILQTEWNGRNFNPEFPELFLRIERQTLTGFPEVSAFLFTIRTYFEEVKCLNQNQLIQLKQALFSMTEKTLIYKGLNLDLINISKYLDSLIEKF